MTRQLRAAAYVRVSSSHKQGERFSPETQLANIRRYCAALNIVIPDEWVIVAKESAWRPGRPDFSRLLKIARAPNGPDIIVFDLVDRAQRNMADYVLLEALADTGVEVHSVGSGIVMRKGEPAGRLMWGMQALFARNFSDVHSMRVRGGLATAAGQGGWPHHAPYGYLNVRVAGRAGVEIHPEQGPCVRALFRWALEGATCREIAARALASGFPMARHGRWTAARVRGLLRERFYQGERVWRGDVAPGRHPALITPDEWAAVQARLTSRRRGTARRRHDNHLAGLVTCARCGCALTTFHVKKPSGRTYSYLRCSWMRGRCVSKLVRVERMEGEIASALDALRLGEWADEIRLALRLVGASGRQVQAEERRRLAGEQARLRKSLGTLYDDRLDGRISAAEYDERAAGARARLEAVGSLLGELEAGDLDRQDEAALLVDVLEQAGARFRKANAERKRRIARLLIQTATWDGESLAVEHPQALRNLRHGLVHGEASGGTHEERDHDGRPTAPRFKLRAPAAVAGALLVSASGLGGAWLQEARELMVA